MAFYAGKVVARLLTNANATKFRSWNSVLSLAFAPLMRL